MKDCTIHRQASAGAPYAHPRPYLARINSEHASNSDPRQYAAHRVDVNGIPQERKNLAGHRAFSSPIPHSAYLRGITLDQAATIEELRRRQDAAYNCHETAHPGQQRNGNAASYSKRHSSPSSEELSNVNTLPTPQSPTHPQFNTPQKTADFTVNVPVDATQPFTFTENIANDEFPTLSDLLHTPQARPTSAPIALPPVEPAQPSRYCLPYNNEGLPYYTPIYSVPGQSMQQNIQSVDMNGYELNTEIARFDDQAATVCAPAPIVYSMPYPVYANGFIRSTAPSPSPYTIIPSARVLTTNSSVPSLLQVPEGDHARVRLWLRSLPKHFNNFLDPFTADEMS